MRRLAVAAVVFFAAQSAHAAESALTSGCDTIGKRNAISTQPLALIGRGVAVDYERLVAPPRFSLVGVAGVRGPALGDYTSTTADLGVEGRVWARPDAGKSCANMAMSGPYLGLRFDVGYTWVTDRTVDRVIGRSVGFDPTLAFGWRFVAWRLLEITPSIQGGARIDYDTTSRLVAWARPTIGVGLSVGWMF